MSAFNVYNGNGTQTLFPITFNYFSASDIEVWLWDETSSAWGLCTEGVNYNISGTNIEIIDTNVGGGGLGGIPGLGGPPGLGGGAAPAAPPTGITGNVLIVRRTDIGGYSGTVVPKAVFQAGTSINAADLNNNQTQVLRAIQDAQASNIANPGVVSGAGVLENKIYSNLDLTGREITNIGTGTGDGSGVNRKMLGDIIANDITADSNQGISLTKTEGGTNSGDEVVIVGIDATRTQKGVLSIDEGEGIDLTFNNGAVTVNGEDSSKTNKGVVTINEGHAVGVTYTSGDAVISADKSTATQQGVVKLSATVPLLIDRPADGEVTLSVSDNSIDLAKLKSSQIVTSTEQEATNPNWSNNNNLIATVGAIAERNDLIIQSNTPTGTAFAVGRLWFNLSILHTWDGTAWTPISSSGGDSAFIETPQTITTNKVIAANTNAGMMGPTVALNTGVTITVGTNSVLTTLA